MKSLRSRLEKLETRMGAAVDEVAFWLGQTTDVEECALRKLSLEDLIFLSDLFALDDTWRRNELIRMNRAVWNRWRAAWG